MKLKIKVILPIALAIFLPIMNLFSNSKDLELYSTEFLFRWFSSSVISYVLWYLLLYISNIKSKYSFLYLTLTVMAYIAVVYLIFAFAIFREPPHIRWPFIFKIIFASILFLIIQYAFRASREIAQLTIEKERVQSENYKAQLQELRLKVDPHFLFNTLNTLRTMIRVQNPQSEDFVMNLSNFYRQTLKINSSSVVDLGEEIEVLKSYLFLMQVRNEGKLEIDIQVDEKLLQYSIPTLSLQIVSENCFKHNQASVSSPLHIAIYNDNDYYIAVKNNLQPKFSKSESSGYGLENIRKRYELLGIEQGVIVNSTDDYFEVKLKLI